MLVVSDTSVFTLRATCDNRMTLFVDGTQRQPTSGSLTSWTEEKIFQIEQTFQTIAIKCRDTGGAEGTLASVENASGRTFLVTDGSWRCADSEQLGWTAADFNEDPAVWKSAVEIGAHGMGPWGVVGSISQEAKWIWYQNRAVDISFCRFTRPKGKN